MFYLTSLLSLSRRNLSSGGYQWNQILHCQQWKVKPWLRQCERYSCSPGWMNLQKTEYCGEHHTESWSTVVKLDIITNTNYFKFTKLNNLVLSSDPTSTVVASNRTPTSWGSKPLLVVEPPLLGVWTTPGVVMDHERVWHSYETSLGARGLRSGYRRGPNKLTDVALRAIEFL